MNNKPNFENAPGIDNDYEIKMQNEIDSTSAKIQAIWEQNQAEDKEREGIRESRKRIPNADKVEIPEQNTKKLESNRKVEVENEFEDFESYQKASEKAKKKNSYQGAKRIVAEQFESRQKKEQERLSQEEASEPEGITTAQKENPETKNKLVNSVKDSINKLFSEKENNTEGNAVILPEEKGIKIEKYVEPSLLEKTQKGFRKALVFFGLTGKKKDGNFEKMTLVKKGDVIEAEDIEAEEIKDEATTKSFLNTTIDDINGTAKQEVKPKQPKKTTPEIQKNEKLEAFTNQVSTSLSLAIERHLRDYPEIKAYALNAFPSLVEDFKLGYEGSKTEEEKKELLNWVTSFCEDKSFFLSQMKHFKMEEAGADEDEVEEITRINTHREKGEFPETKKPKTTKNTPVTTTAKKPKTTKSTPASPRVKKIKTNDNTPVTPVIEGNGDLKVSVVEGLKFFRENGSLMVGAFQNKFGLNLEEAEKLIEKVERVLDGGKIEDDEELVKEGVKFFRENGSLMVGAFQRKFGLNLEDAEKLIKKVEKIYDEEQASK